MGQLSVKRLAIIFGASIGGFFLTIAIVGALHLATDRVPVPTKAAAVETTPALDKSPAMQAERKRIMDQLVADGYVTEIVHNAPAMPRVWVTRRFTSGDFKSKQNIVSAVYAYYFDGTKKSDSIALIDSVTGKEIARFDSQLGLH